MNEPKNNLHGLDRAALLAVIEPVCAAHGAEVFDVEWKNEAGWILRVFVEKAGSAERKATTLASAASLELCADVARDLSPALDAADLIPHRYNLEVSSPGIERPLRGEADFARFVGERAKVKFTEPVDGQKVLVGTIGPAPAPGELAVWDGTRETRFKPSQIASARLVFVFGPQPKPGKKPVKAKSAQR